MPLLSSPVMSDAALPQSGARGRVGALPARTWLTLALLSSSAGVLVVSLAYAAGRDGHSWAAAVYWIGHLLLFAPLAAYVLSPQASDRWVAILALGLFQALTKWMYSPVMFKFPDELQHTQTAVDILQQQSLFHANPALPVSPQFPGLEEITTALMSITGLSQFAAGQVVVAIAHVVLIAGVFVLLLRVTGDDWIAGIGSLVFAISPHNGFFNALWIYEAVALVFMVVAMIAALRRDSAAGLVTAIVCMAAATVTHHVTAAMTALILIVLGVGVGLQSGSLTTSSRRLIGLGTAAAVLIAGWVIFVAPATYDYLAGSAGDVISGFLHAGSASGNETVSEPSVSLATTAATAIGTLTVIGLVSAGALTAWYRNRDALTRTFAFLGLGFFAILGVRFLVSNGAELAGRLLTFEYLFIGVAAALALTQLWTMRPRIAGALGLGAVVLVFVGNTTSGWPATWEIVPGKFKVDAFESGVDPAGVRAARWAAANLPSGAQVACDWTACSLLGGYGQQTAYADVPDIFYSSSFDATTLAALSDRGIDFVLVDRRITSQKPVTGKYFDHESPAQQAIAPLPASALAKFDRDARVSRVYDGGPLAVYDVRRLRGA
jgi:hypothetical protein